MTLQPLFSLPDLQAAIEVVRPVVGVTPAYAWPLLREEAGLEVIVKHENHTPTGAFKVRGGLTYLDWMRRSDNLPKGVVSATRGNHGQSIALAAARHNVAALIVVPEGNSPEKNAAMQAFGAELIVAGKDFDESRVIAAQLGQERGFHFVPSFHSELVKGVATYALELFEAWANLDVVYVPIGMGSGICGVITVRDLLGLDTEVVGVVSSEAPAFAHSFASGQAVSSATANTFADGLACREPQPLPLELICQGAARIVQVSETEIADAVRLYYRTTHNLAEGAGAAPLAALMQEKNLLSGKRAGVILCGGNIDAPVFQQILAGGVPTTA